MLELLAAALVVVWILGLVTSTTMSGFIHVLLAAAIVVVVVSVLGG